ncbi:hypothetical protein ACKFRL_04465 [Corynebacterium marquesiae]|uniref:hypothetical protein n=1 Tax=Corynebacterium marquesiae TaxID=2913503 RepID=UPI00204ED1A7|nr:MAG TPA_asm: pNOB8 ParB like protein [Caudoviricetes sp.]
MFISNTIKTDIVTITPQLAAQLLEQNTGNRKVSKANYHRVLEAMSKGEWELNGEAIKIARDGRILDGQHRLMVAAENDLTFQTLVVYGLPDETQDTMDTGKARTASDVLAINGYPSSNNLAAIVSGIIRSERWGLKPATAVGATAYPVTPKQVLARVQQEPSLVELMQLTIRIRNKTPLPGKVAGVLYYHFSKIDQQDTDYFFDRLANGDGLERGNPILTLRETLFSLKENTKGARNSQYIAALVIKAWNKYRRGETCSILRYTPGGAKPESFPEPI